MKTNKLIIFILAIAASISFTSCVEDGDFTVPQNLGAEESTALQALLNPNPENPDDKFNEISMVALKNLFVADQVTEITSNLYVKGYVTSSDQSGNFFKEFFIQDAPENPTTAIKVVTEFVDAYNKYNFGREVYINLKGLFIGEVRSGDGVIAIGGARNFDNEVENLSLNQTQNLVLRSSKTETIVPVAVGATGITEDRVGMFVEVNDIFYYPEGSTPVSFVDADEAFDTQRTFSGCAGFGYAEFTLETSAFSEFKFETIPTGGGSISGVVSKTFNGSEVVLALNSSNDVNLGGDICMPLDINDFTATISEDFENMPSSSPLGGNGWIAFGEEGRFNWRVRTSSDTGNPGSRIASMGAFRSGDDANIAWLISPAIDLDAQDLEFLNFESSNSFADGSELQVLISTDWDGATANITTATWQELEANVVSDGEFYQNWVDSGTTDLSAFSGTAYIAFKYIGGTNSAIDGTYEIDNFKILVRN